MATKHQLKIRALDELIKAQCTEIEDLEEKLKEANEKLRIAENMATYDFLTGHLNRRGGEEILSHHFSILKRANGNKSNLAVLYLDLDRFKGINDKFGHDIGDNVLKFFSHTLNDVLRNEHDVVVRMGGDEFVIVLPECTLAQAEVVKGKIKNALAKKAFASDNVKLHLRTSIGVAMAYSEGRRLSTVKKILIQADKAMYEDKKAGEKLRIQR